MCLLWTCACRFLMKETCLLFHSGAHNLLLTLASICSTVHPLKQQHATWQVFFFSGPQASRVYHILSAPQVALDRNQSRGQPPAKLEHSTYAPLFPFCLRERLLEREASVCCPGLCVCVFLRSQWPPGI